MCATDGGGNLHGKESIILILTRKPGESVRIDGPCVVTYLEGEGGRVRIGFTAEPSVAIVRTELESSVPWHPPTRLYHPDAKPATKLATEND